MSLDPVTLRDRIISHSIGLVFFVVLPALLTATMPVTWTTFSRQGDRVEMKASVCLFFVVPFRHESVTAVTGVEKRSSGGGSRRIGGHGSDRNTMVHTAKVGFLTVKGSEQEAEIAVAVGDLEEVQRKVQSFLADKAAPELKLFTVANWTVSAIIGGIATFFAALYLFGMVWTLLSALFKRMKSSR